MDPNVTLAEIRAIARLSAEGRLYSPAESLERMGELIVALDEWIAGGGFLPDAWQR